MLNKCCFIGNLGRDPEIKSTQNGNRVANISLGVSESWKNKQGEKQEKTEWVRVTVWNEGIIGVVEKYCHKGDRLYIEGKMETRKYTDKDGNEKYSTEIVLGPFDSKLVLLGDANKADAGISAHSSAKADAYVAPSPESAVAAIEDDTIPFVWVAGLIMTGLSILSSVPNVIA